VARKEFLHILRDVRSLILALALPLLLLLLFGYALSLDVDRIPTAVYDLDQSPQSRELVSRFEGSRFFAILDPAGSYPELVGWIDTGECLMGIVIPRDFSRDLARRETSLVQILLDGSDSNTASIARGYAEGIIQTHALSLLPESAGALSEDLQLLRSELRVWYNPELESRNYIVPGLVAVILMIISALLTSLTIAREWEMGTMEQLLSTPVRPAELVLGKLSAYIAVGAVDAFVAIVTGVFLFEVPLKGSILFLAVSSTIFLFGALCWGVLISAIAKNQLLAYQMSTVSSFLPAFLLSGFIYAIENMPLPVQVVTYIIPARYFIRILKGIFLKGVGPEFLIGEILFLLIFSALVFLAATRQLKGKVA